MKLNNLTLKELTFTKTYIENGGNGTQAALVAYNTDNPVTAASIAYENLRKPQIKDALQDALDEDILAKKHSELLNSTRIEHVVFTTGFKTQKLKDEYNRDHKKHCEEKGKKFVPNDSLTDEEIVELLAEKNCTVRKIQHSEFSRHVYFWANDNRAVKDALDMAYKIKGTYAPDKKQNLNVNVDVPSDRIKDLTKKLNK